MMHLIPLESTHQYIFLFFIFSIVGILGESLFCYCWKLLHGERFWDYKIGTLFNGYSSWLNIIPWGLGGYLYVFIYEYIQSVSFNPYEYELGIIWGVVAFMLLFPFVFSFLLHQKPTRNISKSALILFLPLLFIASLDIVMLIFLISGSLIAGVLEYLYGKVMSCIFGKKLWVYNILPRDGGHISLVAPLGFALAGIWFLAVYQSFLMFM
jgi:hypothetical protein